jgi:hypothetical protein
MKLSGYRNFSVFDAGVGDGKLSVLPFVKAYPNLSRQYGEVSCVAGITIPHEGESSELIRIYPVPFRALDDAAKFHKYQPIRVDARRPKGDLRPESRKVDVDTIEIIGPVIDTKGGWAKRRPLVEPLIGGSMCDLLRQEKLDRTSLRILRPAEVLGMKIEEGEVDPEKGRRAEAWASQSTLLDQGERKQERKALEQIPYKFKYVYRCSDPTCKTHTQSVVDWEIVELYRKVRDRENWRDLIEQKWVGEMCGAAKDTAFIVGNQKRYRGAFLVLGVWRPPKENQPQLSLSEFGDV